MKVRRLLDTEEQGWSTGPICPILMPSRREQEQHLCRGGSRVREGVRAAGGDEHQAGGSRDDSCAGIGGRFSSSAWLSRYGPAW